MAQIPTVVGIDLETWHTTQGQQAPPPVCLSYCEDDERGHVVGAWTPSFEAKLAHYLSGAIDGRYILAVHNAAFDFAVLLAHCPSLRPLIWDAYESGRVCCTRMRERLIAIRDGELRFFDAGNGRMAKSKYDLGFLMERHFDVALDKSEDSWRKRYPELYGVPVEEWPEAARDYSEMDAVSHRALFLHQSRRAHLSSYSLPTQALETRADLVLRLCSAWGPRTDGEAVEAVSVATAQKLASLKVILLQEGIIVPKRKLDMTALLEQAGVSVSTIGSITEIPAGVQLRRDMKMVKRRVEDAYARMGMIAPQTDKGATSTAKLTIEEIVDDDGLHTMLEHNSLEKSASTYIEKLWRGVDGPIHSWFDALGASSSRSSSKDPNLQNQPKLPGVRECFVPRAGNFFVSVDFSAQEMRTWAQACLDLTGESVLARRFQENPDFDPHSQLAALHGVSRQHAKIANFGIPGGMGVTGLIGYARGYGQTMTEAEATTAREAFFATWPEARTFFSIAKQRPGVEAKMALVEIPQSGFLRGGCGYTDSCNTQFQSLAAHSSKEAMWQVVRRCYDERMGSWLLGSRAWNFVHDEIDLEVEEDVAHEVAVETRRVMEEAQSKWTPDIPARAEASVMRRWSKEAKPVLDKSGRLIPYEDAEAS